MSYCKFDLVNLYHGEIFFYKRLQKYSRYFKNPLSFIEKKQLCFTTISDLKTTTFFALHLNQINTLMSYNFAWTY